MAVLTSKHLFHLKQLKPQIDKPGGWRIKSTVEEFPVLKDISLSLLNLHPLAVREPHWHTNAHELLYCIDGKALMTIFTPEDDHETFTVDAGELVFIPRNYLHHIENIGQKDANFLICFSHENPQDLQISTAVESMSDHVLGATFSVPDDFFKRIRPPFDAVHISQRKVAAHTDLPKIPNRFKLDLEGMNPQVQSAGGWAKKANKKSFEMLDQLGLFSLLLEVGGIREPHWHPDAHELNYLFSGNCRVTLLNPQNEIETFEMQAGDMSYLPMGYFHHIENIGSTPAKFAVFFSNENPTDIGLSGALGAFSNEVLASVFGKAPEDFAALPKYQQDLVVVKG